MGFVNCQAGAKTGDGGQPTRRTKKAAAVSGCLFAFREECMPGISDLIQVQCVWPKVIFDSRPLCPGFYQH